MKKFLILLIAIGLLASCKSKESSNDPKTENKAKDDYQQDADKKSTADKDDAGATDYKEKTSLNADELDEDGNSKADIESINGQDDSESNWPQSERDAFMTNCVRQAVKGGQSRSVSQKYCDCMLGTIEGMYPDIKDAAKLTSTEIDRITKKYGPGCLK